MLEIYEPFTNSMSEWQRLYRFQLCLDSIIHNIELVIKQSIKTAGIPITTKHTFDIKTILYN